MILKFCKIYIDFLLKQCFGALKHICERILMQGQKLWFLQNYVSIGWKNFRLQYVYFTLIYWIIHALCHEVSNDFSKQRNILLDYGISDKFQMISSNRWFIVCLIDFWRPMGIHFRLFWHHFCSLDVCRIILKT